MFRALCEKGRQTLTMFSLFLDPEDNKDARAPKLGR